MTDPRAAGWARVEEILDAALELEESALSGYLARACGEDDELRREVESLLAADREAGTFLEAPAGEYAATLVDEMQTWSQTRVQPRSPDEQLEGRQLGPYEVKRRIGGGGMGVVWEAVDTRLDRRVALKLLPTAWNRNPDARERFVREAKAASALDHPNICTVHDIGETESGHTFIVMAYYEGETLESRLEQGELKIEDVREIALQIGRGLERAHAAGIVHRDIKPANVILTAEGEGSPGWVKILDFGIAKVAGDHGLTRSGTSPGTPAYMSPEQSRGDEVDGRTDVWSLAAVLYQMLAGRRPFEGKSEMAIYMAIQAKEPTSVAMVRADVPTDLARAVLRGLTKDLDERTADMTEMLGDLEGMPSDETLALRLADALGAEGLLEGVAVRTLLLTELVDSAELFDPLGDRQASQVRASHDRLARDLLASHDGLEIDRADGFLMLFERSIDAVAFALAYHRGLEELGAQLEVSLAARVALHLGEVHLRRNLPQDVERGAKAIEVEGLAKPLVARLAGLAGTGQTLLTQGAFDLARRASDERTLQDEVSWVAHGEYQFDGLAEPIDVFEVGTAGTAPLSPPGDSDKARRVSAAGETLILGWRPAVGQSLPDRRHWVMREKVGEGAFGEVWLARHAKTHEPRVFKFCYEAERLKSLEREVTLFRLMKEALGDRDDIVRILDWNFDEAPFYLESEYTEGGDLRAWVVARGGLEAISMEDRLEIVARAADALGAAHSVGILHKDVKPANLLVNEGHGGAPRVRLTDFGVGWIMDVSLLGESGVTVRGLTQDDTLASAGTHLYMAPEVLEGKVPTVQADLYALGVMLYQMVVGDFSRALARGWQRDVHDEVLRDDIATFVDGSPERRPAGAQEIAERLRGLETRRAERLEREREREQAEENRRALERGRRRRRLLAVAVAVLAIFGAAMSWQVRQTRLQAERAEREAAVALRVSGFLEELFEVVDPSEARGNSVTAREILDRGAQRIEDELADQPEIQARLMGVMGGVYANLGLYDQAQDLAERALATGRSVHGDDHLAVAEILHRMGRLQWLQGEYDAAGTSLERALEIRRRELEAGHEDIAATLCHLGDVWLERTEFDRAQSLFEECLSLRRQRFGEPHDDVAEALWSLASVEHHRDGVAAEPLYQQAVAMYESLHSEPYPALGEVLNNYAYLLMTRGDYAAAEPLFQRSIEIKRVVLGEKHHYTCIGENNLAIVLNARGNHVAAEPLARHAGAAFRESFGDEHWQTAIADSVLGASLAGQGRFEEAEPLLLSGFERIWEQRRNEFGYGKDALRRLAALYDAWGKPEAADRYRELPRND